MFNIDTGLIFWTILSFAILLVLLYKLVFPPLLKVLDQRHQAIEGRLAKAQKAQADAEGLLETYREQMAEAERKSLALFDEARRKVQSFREESLKSAQKEARQIIENTKEDIEVFKRKAMGTFKGEIADVVVEVNQKVLQKELSAKDQNRLVETALKELGKYAEK